MKQFLISAYDAAALIMLNASISQILESGEITPDIMEELEYLHPMLENIAFGQEKGSLQTPSKAL